MKERLPRRIETPSTHKLLMEGVVRAIDTMPETITPESASRAVLNRFAIKTTHTYESNDMGLEEARRRLQKERGLLIANHPGGGDVFAVLETIGRTDVRVLVSQDAYEYLSGVEERFNINYFIEASRDPRGALNEFKKIQAHLQSGGLFVLFPGGGYENGTPSPFKRGFSLIVEKMLSPEDMIYACNVELGNTSKKGVTLSRLGAVPAENLLDSNGTLQSLIPDSEIRVREKYTQAGEWQRAVEERNEKTPEDALTEHFNSIFGV